MALLVLVSTFSFTVDKHYCGDTLIDQAVFSKAKECGMDMMGVASTKHFPVFNAPGCHNKISVIKGQENLNAAPDISFHQQVFLAAFTFSYINLFKAESEQVIPFQNYSPPLLVSDIQLQDQVFLI
ncbi:MAG: hypothetical protein WCD31_10590 [Gillisia sp.]